MLFDTDTDAMHPDDPLVVFKLSDMKHPIAGRFRQFVDKGRWTKSPYCYVHRGDGLIINKYSSGVTILKTIDFEEKAEE